MTSLNETSFLKDLLKLNDFPESRWQNYEDELRDYLNFLCRCDLQKLHSEILAVQEDQRRVVREEQELAFTNYKTFIDVADCTHEMLVEFNQLQDSLALVINGLPKLSEKSESLLKEIHSLSQARKQNAITLGKHPQLLELLELSQLMETAVRNSYYDEALELLNYVRRIEKKHARDIPLVRALCADVKRIGQALVTQLIQQLHGAAPLSQSLKIVSLLRRMELLSEAELRLLFLQARTRHVDTALSSIQPLREKDVYTYLCRFIETNRVQLFDVITQYRAIFADDIGSFSSTLLGGDAVTTASAGKPLGSGESLTDNPIWDELGSAILPTAGGDETARTGLAHLWITQRVGSFFDTMSSIFLDMSTFEKLISRFDSLAVQCNYFALSLARVGCDLRPLVNALFVRTVTNCLDVRLAGATHAVLEQLASHADRDPTPLRGGATLAHFQQNIVKQLENMSARCEAAGYVRTLLADSSFSTATVATSCLCDDALLHFANSVVSTLNDLRPTLTLATLFHAQSTVQSTLEQLANTICSYLQGLQAQSSATNADRRDATASEFEARWCDGLLCVVAPYLHFTFVALQPPIAELLQQFGTKSQSELFDLGVRVGLNATRLFNILSEVSSTAKSRLKAIATRFDTNEAPQSANLLLSNNEGQVNDSDANVEHKAASEEPDHSTDTVQDKPQDQADANAPQTADDAAPQQPTDSQISEDPRHTQLPEEEAN